MDNALRNGAMLKTIGGVVYQDRGDGYLIPVGNAPEQFAPAPTNALNPFDDALRYYLGPTGIPDRLAQVNALMNPIEAMGGSMEASQRMFAPETSGWGRVEALGDMLSGVAGVVAPAFAARYGAVPVANAVEESLLGFSTSPNALALRDFAADEYGGIRAFHGSPHDFDRFDMSKIGTGEGAQAYGHGLYFADNEDVAKAYRDALRFPRMDSIKTPRDAVIDDLNYHRGNVEGVRRSYEAMISSGNPDAVKMGSEKLALLDSVVADNPGRMYEVQINANPDDFLDWDKPLSEQPRIAERLGVDPNANARRAAEIRARVAEDMRLDGRTAPDEIDQRNLDLAAQIELQSATGDASSYAPRSMQMVEELRAKGIPGIRYLDAGSRPDMRRVMELREEAKNFIAMGKPEYAAEANKLADAIEGSGSRNYVVFDDQLIEIVRKYGWAAAAPALAAMGLTPEQAQAMAPELEAAQ